MTKLQLALTQCHVVLYHKTLELTHQYGTIV